MHDSLLFLYLLKIISNCCPKVVSAASRLQTRYSALPTLDLKGKKKEIESLLEELVLDSKRSFIRERSNRDELLSEIIESLTSWLSDIWVVVYEFNVHFALAHECLLYAAGVLAQLNSAPDIGGCARSSFSIGTFRLMLHSCRS